MITTEQVDRMGTDFLKHIYRIRQQVFEKELSFPKQDRMTYNEWDALANHYMVLVNGSPVGAVAVVDWTGITEKLLERGINPNLRVAKVTKLAVLPEHRGIITLKTLLQPVQKECGDYDLVLAEVAPPSNRLDDTTRYEMGKKYQRLFGLDFIGDPSINGIKTHILGKPFSHN